MKDALPIIGLIVSILALLRQNRQLTASVTRGTPLPAPLPVEDRISQAWARRRQARNPGHEPEGEAEPQPIPIGL